MKSILLTSSSSSDSSTSSSNSHTSNNLSLLAESYTVNEDSHSETFGEGSAEEIGDDCLTETLFVDNKLLGHSGSNIKKQVIKNNKIILKNDDKKLKRSERNIFSDIECEKRWQKAPGDVNSDYFSLSLENHPLIDTKNVIGSESDSLSSRGKLIPTVVAQANSTTSATKLINLRKKNGTTLIFQRKNCSQPPTSDCSEYQELEIESFKKRQSLNWPYKSAISNKPRHFSWHDPYHYSQHSIEEEFENSVSATYFNILAIPL